MCEIVENMSSKKYDANIGTTRHAHASQQALLLSFKDLTTFAISFLVFIYSIIKILILLFNVRKLKAITFFLVLYL